MMDERLKLLSEKLRESAKAHLAAAEEALNSLPNFADLTTATAQATLALAYDEIADMIDGTL
jgi:hypothetical protein